MSWCHLDRAGRICRADDPPSRSWPGAAPAIHEKTTGFSLRLVDARPKAGHERVKAIAKSG
jgi:hypothetical protein